MREYWQRSRSGQADGGDPVDEQRTLARNGC